MASEKSDEELMMLVAQGHRLSFDHLVRRHLARAFSVACRIGGVGDAEDIVQEAFLKLWISAPSWRSGRSRFGAWFYRIVVNASLDRLRRRKHFAPVVMENLPDPAPGIETTTAERQEMRRIVAAVSRLPEKQRAAIMLCYQKGMTNAQAAEMMGLHIKSLEGLLARARKTLRNDLETTRG